MKHIIKRDTLTFLIVNIVILNCLLTGCGGDEVVEEDVSDSLIEEMGGGDKDATERLYEELVGEYELIRSIVKYADGGETLDLKPPEVTGFMTIALNRWIKQEVEVAGNRIVAEGTFEIFPDEGIIEVRQGVVTIPLIYTWDGSILTTALDFGAYFETDYWRKL